MDCFSSTIHEYQPILVGAGCLALGYMYGRHCRSVMENRVDAPAMSDAVCCVGTDSFNYVPEPAAAMVDPETMAIVRQWLNPAEAEWDFSDRELTEKPERCAKRDLEILPRKEDMIWNQNVFKKQKSAPAVRREVIRTKPESDQDSDDERLASRLQFFTKSLSGTRASINKKPTRPTGELHRHDVATSCEEAKIFQEIAINTPRKGAARSLSGLGALASPQEDESSPGSSVEDTCRSPKTVFLGDGEDEEQEDVLERSCQVEFANSVPQGETESLVRGNCGLSSDCDFEQLVGCERFVGLVGSKEQTVVENEDDENRHVRMEVDAHEKVDPAIRLELPTSPPPELLHGEQEGTGVGEGNAVASAVPAIVLAEINERLLQLPQAGAANCGEKKKNKTSRSSCFKAMPKSIWLQWLEKLASSWRKKCKLWRRHCNKNKSQQQQQPSSKEMALYASVEESQSGLPKMVKPCGALVD